MLRALNRLEALPALLSRPGLVRHFTTRSLLCGVGAAPAEPAVEKPTSKRLVSTKSAWEGPVSETPDWVKPSHKRRAKPKRNLATPELPGDPQWERIGRERREWKKYPTESWPQAVSPRPPIIPELPEGRDRLKHLKESLRQDMSSLHPIRLELLEKPERESNSRDKRESREHSREKSSQERPREIFLRKRLLREVAKLVEETQIKRLKRRGIRAPRSSKSRLRNPIPGESPPKEPPVSTPLPSSSEDYQRIGISNLTKEDIDYLTRVTKMNAVERRNNILEQMGWSLKVPYSKELYNFARGQPKHLQLWRRVIAAERLRMVMGHGVRASTKNLWLKELPLRLRRSNMRDVRFICIDTDKVERLPQVLEGEWKRRVTSFQLGVAILDTRDIRDFIVGRVDVPNPSEIISTYQFSVQSDPPEHEEFLFGKTQSISLSDLRAKFVEWQAGRDVIAIAYSVRNDMIVLKDFNISLNSTFSIDLCQATYLIVQEPTAPTLGLLLQRLKIPCRSLHAPGNDAHFTMRALLGLAALDVARGLEAGRPLKSVPPWFQLAVNIARSPVPSTHSGPRRERKRVRTGRPKLKRKPKRRRGIRN